MGCGEAQGVNAGEVLILRGNAPTLVEHCRDISLASLKYRVAWL